MKLRALFSKREALLVVCTLMVVTAAIYVTPLRYTALVAPRTHDVDASLVHAQMKEHPEKYLFLDVRPQGDYMKVHAEGSISVPIHLLYDQQQTLPRSGKEIVLICSGGRLSGVAFFFLQHFGFTNIARISGGLDAWISEGLPVDIPEDNF